MKTELKGSMKSLVGYDLVQFFLVQNFLKPVQIFWTSTNFWTSIKFFEPERNILNWYQIIILSQYRIFEPVQNILIWYQMFQTRSICFNLANLFQPSGSISSKPG